jgi:hypothetical protein
MDLLSKPLVRGQTISAIAGVSIVMINLVALWQFQCSVSAFIDADAERDYS